MRLLIVIVNYRTAELTIDCLRSLAPRCRPCPRAHASSSPTTPPATTRSSDWPPRSATTAGATGRRSCRWRATAASPTGNNEAIRPALAGDAPADYVLLLNPDTVVRPGAVRRWSSSWTRTPTVGIAGSRLEDPDGTPQRSAFRFPGVMSELETARGSGSCRELLNRFVVAPPPPTEACEVGLGRRGEHDRPPGGVRGDRPARRAVLHVLRGGRLLPPREAAGWPCWYVPASRVVHLVGQSSGVTDEKKPKKRRPAYWFESRRRYFLLHSGRVGTFLADTFWVAGYALYKATVALRKRPANDPDRLLGTSCGTTSGARKPRGAVSRCIRMTLEQTHHCLPRPSPR